MCRHSLYIGWLPPGYVFAKFVRGCGLGPMIVLAYRCIVQILPPVGRQNDELYGVVIFPRKHESPPLPAGFFLSLSSLAIQGEIIGAMAPVFALWIVGVRRF